MNTEEYGNDLITELRDLQSTVFFCTVEVSIMLSVYVTIFQLLHTPFAMTSFLTNGCLSGQWCNFSLQCCSPRHSCLFFGLDWQSCVCVWVERCIMISSRGTDVCVWCSVCVSHVHHSTVWRWCTCDGGQGCV